MCGIAKGGLVTALRREIPARRCPLGGGFEENWLAPEFSLDGGLIQGVPEGGREREEKEEEKKARRYREDSAYIGHIFGLPLEMRIRIGGMRLRIVRTRR